MNYTKMQYISNEKIQQVLSTVDFQTYFDAKVIPLMPDYYRESGAMAFINGTSGKCKCPLKEENTPSFSLKTWETGITTFKCFSCDKSGNIIKFHRYFVEEQEDRKISYQEAANELYQEFIEGRKIQRSLTGNKIRLKSDVPVRLSTLNDITEFSLLLSSYNNFMNLQKVNNEEDRYNFYDLMDTLEFMVVRNRIPAVEAMELLEKEYKELKSDVK